MNDDKLEASYNEVLYPSSSFLITHPNRLAAIATLLGLSPTPVEQCRVLELGCASGGNIIPMAYGLPGSEFVGVDFAIRQIEQAQAAVQTLGLTNLRLEHRNILDIGSDFGRFDYIIAHGVYSWVPQPVRDRLLAVCKQNLNPNGVAYVSYNAYPGGALFQVMGEMMRYHTRDTSDPLERLAKARSFMELLAQAMPDDDYFGYFLRGYVENRLKPGSKRYPGEGGLLHDEFEIVNTPFYFYQFVEHAARHGLQYLGEARLSTMLGSRLPAELLAKIARISKDMIEYEQNLSFLQNQGFRETLLCHADIPLTLKIRPEIFSRLYVATPSQPESQTPNLADLSVEKFKAADGATFSTDHPLTKAALFHLAQLWPQGLHFEALLDIARSLAADKTRPAQADDATRSNPDDRAILAANFIKAYGYSEQLLELYCYPPRFTTNIAERPVASAVARYQAQQGSLRVTNLRHGTVEINQLEQYILIHLDGRHDHTDLLNQLATLVMEGSLTLTDAGQPVRDAQQARSILVDLLEEALQRLAQTALLEVGSIDSYP
jgi:methyltransferase-like protein/SAM-dependent methyltransferase